MMHGLPHATPSQAQALPDNVIIIHLSLSEAAALQDAMDARSHSVDATSAAFLQAQRKLGEAIAANPDAQLEYAQNGQNRTTSVIADVTFNP
jgi:hypothetical protein